MGSEDTTRERGSGHATQDGARATTARTALTPHTQRRRTHSPRGPLLLHHAGRKDCRGEWDWTPSGTEGGRAIHF